MSQEYLIAYLAVLCPIKFTIETYKNLVKCITDSQLDDAILHHYIKTGILIKQGDYLLISSKYYNKVYDEFNKLSDILKNKYIFNASNKIKKYLSTSIYYNIISTYLNILDDTTKITSQINNILDKQIYSLLLENNIDLQQFIEISNAFTSSFVSDELKTEIINVYYKYNQNRIVVNIFNSIEDKNLINAETLIKISSSFYMLSEDEKANSILKGIKEKFDDKNIALAIRIIELINKYESNSDSCEIEKLKTEFYNLVQNIELTPNCANLLLKISSSILPHEEAIELMINSNLSNHIFQVFNNLGAVYLTEGAKKCLINPKDKDYIIKAEKYLNFAKTYGAERGEYSAYLSLNLLTLRFYKEYKKKSLTKQYKTIYNNYRKLNNKADSLYFKSIILCNCFILEKLTTKNNETINSYLKQLNSIKQNTCDIKVKEKIDMFLNFNPLHEKYIPIWIITETHY